MGNLEIRKSVEWQRKQRSQKNIIIHLLNKYILSVYYVPGSLLSSADRAVNKWDQNSCTHEAYTTVGKDNKHTHTHIIVFKI